MDRDTPDKFEQFNQSNYRPLFGQSSGDQQTNHQSSSALFQSNYDNFNQENQTNVQLSNQGGESNAQWFNQSPNKVMSQPNNNWAAISGSLNNNTNVPVNVGNDRTLQRANSNALELSPQELKLMKDCSSQGFWYLTLPSVIGFICYKQYSSVKNLQPYTMASLAWQTVFMYFGTKVLWTPFCWNRLLRNSPDMKQRLERMRNEMPQNRSQSFQPAYQQQSLPSQQQSNFRPPNSPYLQTSYTQPQQRQFNKEFVDDNYDVSGYNRENK